MRGFVAFGIGEAFAAELFAFASELPGEGLSLLPSTDLHVTLKFLSEFSSDVFVRTLPELCALGPPPAKGLLAGQAAPWPTVVALECHPSPELVRWHGDLNALLERKGFLHERHPRFRPHITLARRKGVKGSHELAAFLKEKGRALEGRFVPLEAAALWQSQAEETGRRHKPYLSPLFGRMHGIPTV